MLDGEMYYLATKRNVCDIIQPSGKNVIWRQLFPFNWNKARGSINTSLSDKQQATVMPRETDTRKAKTLIRGNSETLGRTFLGNNSIDIKYLEVILKLVLSDT